MGAGNGRNANLFLSGGLGGIAFDLNREACIKSRLYNGKYIDRGDFLVINGDFLSYQPERKFDLVFSSMVIEHLDDEGVNAYFEKCKACLRPGGIIATLVPANMRYWGIEDLTAGHFKRYSFSCFDRIAVGHRLKVTMCAGLTFPLSNLLLGLSNRLVEGSEQAKLRLSKRDQTIQSGSRQVKFKTHFPWYLNWLLNEFTLFPFDVAQRIFGKDNRSMVIYCELVYE